VRAEAPGYASGAASFVLDADVDIVLTLEPNKKAPNAGPRVPAPSEKSTTPKPSSKPSCSPPYYFDEQGLKQYKPECI
jgi:hypothetical protein